jgi:hypothetical protein
VVKVREKRGKKKEKAFSESTTTRPLVSHNSTPVALLTLIQKWRISKRQVEEEGGDQCRGVGANLVAEAIPLLHHGHVARTRRVNDLKVEDSVRYPITHFIFGDTNTNL